MIKKIDELLKPRIKVIFSEYPECVYKLDQIIFFPEKENWFSGENEWVSEPTEQINGCRYQRPLTYFTKYPKCFRLLEWWEDRKPEDMPQYLKAIDDDHLGEKYKVIKYWNGMPLASIGNDLHVHLLATVPITEADYNQQTQPAINTTQKENGK